VQQQGARHPPGAGRAHRCGDHQSVQLNPLTRGVRHTVTKPQPRGPLEADASSARRSRIQAGVRGRREGPHVSGPLRLREWLLYSGERGARRGELEPLLWQVLWLLPSHHSWKEVWSNKCKMFLHGKISRYTSAGVITSLYLRQ